MRWLISISCKAGKYDQQAVYEVKANAEKFGGKRAVPVLCTDLNENHPELVKKADELGVLVIEYQDMWNRRAVDRILAWMKKDRKKVQRKNRRRSKAGWVPERS